MATPPLIGSGVLSKVKRDKPRPVRGVSEVLIENSHLWNEWVSVRRTLIDNNSFKPEVSVIRVSSLSVFKHLLHPRETSESVLSFSRQINQSPSRTGALKAVLHTGVNHEMNRIHRYPPHFSASFKGRSEQVSSLSSTAQLSWGALSTAVIMRALLLVCVFLLPLQTLALPLRNRWEPCCWSVCFCCWSVCFCCWSVCFCCWSVCFCCWSVCFCCLCKHSRCRCATGETSARTRSHLCCVALHDKTLWSILSVLILRPLSFMYRVSSWAFFFVCK